MAEISPFKGMFYNGKKIGDLSRVVIPPYDVISRQAQINYFQRHSNSVVHLVLGKEYPGDDETDNKYTRAALYLDTWLREGVLREDESPSIYAYRQEFSLWGEKRSRLGFISLFKLEDYGKGVIFPHEDTFRRPREDRLRLFLECRANFDQIFSVYSDPDRIVEAILIKGITTDPFIVVEDDDEVLHMLWAIKDPSVIETLKNEMAGKKLVIADGHHRYETALAAREVFRRRGITSGGGVSYDYVTMYFASLENRGTVILPTHRVLRLPYELPTSVLTERLGRYFIVERYEGAEDMIRSGEAVKRFLNLMEEKVEGGTLGIYLGGAEFLLLRAGDGGKSLNEAPQFHAGWEKTDLIYLHKVIFERILGLDADYLEREENICYTVDGCHAARLVDQGSHHAAFFLNPTEKDQVMKSALNGRKLPHKSTYFYPKLLTGLVMSRFS